MIFNIRESSQIQGLFVLHAVSFKETSLENQQIIDIKKARGRYQLVQPITKAPLLLRVVYQVKMNLSIRILKNIFPNL